MTCGTFDLLHAGHVAFLQKCRKLAGDYPDAELVVYLNTDEFFKAKQEKGAAHKPPPILTYSEREYVLRHLKMIDRIEPNKDTSLTGALRIERPDILVIGDDWAHKNYLIQIETPQTVLAANDILLVYVPYHEPLSSSIIKDRVIAQWVAGNESP